MYVVFVLGLAGNAQVSAIACRLTYKLTQHKGGAKDDFGHISGYHKATFLVAPTVTSSHTLLCGQRGATGNQLVDVVGVPTG
ncbi:hypothetical protein FRC07_005432 [Ceratobasidium sp. 392]|nr:hypothetical protein FRC07_005432 [Ceratobasidium sp. 392]